jgi:hypothetical protein
MLFFARWSRRTNFLHKPRGQEHLKANDTIERNSVANQDLVRDHATRGAAEYTTTTFLNHQYLVVKGEHTLRDQRRDSEMQQVPGGAQPLSTVRNTWEFRGTTGAKNGVKRATRWEKAKCCKWTVVKLV